MKKHILLPLALSMGLAPSYNPVSAMQSNIDLLGKTKVSVIKKDLDKALATLQEIETNLTAITKLLSKSTEIRENLFTEATFAQPDTSKLNRFIAQQEKRLKSHTQDALNETKTINKILSLEIFKQLETDGCYTKLKEMYANLNTELEKQDPNLENIGTILSSIVELNDFALDDLKDAPIEKTEILTLRNILIAGGTITTIIALAGFHFGWWKTLTTGTIALMKKLNVSGKFGCFMDRFKKASGHAQEIVIQEAVNLNTAQPIPGYTAADYNSCKDAPICSECMGKLSK